MGEINVLRLDLFGKCTRKKLQHTAEMNEPFVNPYLEKVNVWKDNNAYSALQLEVCILLAECAACYYETGIEISIKYKFY